MDDVGEYFARFGSVKSVSIFREGADHHNLVTFKTVEAAALVLSNPEHRIVDCDIDVKAAEQWQQPDQILNALNEHCFLKIFENLHYSDLVNAAYVCRSFERYAQYTFVQNSMTMSVYDDCIDESLKILNKFGAVAKRVFVNSSSAEVFQTVFDKCSATVENLAISGELQPMDLGDFGCRFVKLKSLCLLGCTFQNLDDSIALCPEMTRLKICRGFWDGECISRENPKLEKLHLFNNNPYSPTNIQLNTFVRLHPGLRKLVLIFEQRKLSVQIFREIGQHLRGLVKLEIKLDEFEDPDEFQENVQNLGQLSSLRVLRVDFKSMSVTPLIKALAENQVPIEELALEHGEIDTAAIAYMAELKQMKSVSLYSVSGLPNGDIFQLVQQLPDLVIKID